MDYQFAFVVQLFVVCGILNCALGIVGRDLVLTPRQGLQINGKSLYYADDYTAEKATINPNRTSSAWERTLKHVTFVTLFSNAAVEAVAGNLSKLREYNHFLQSPYVVSQSGDKNPRFGDIVTLASGRLDQLGNGSFRFVEGVCNDATCDEDRVLATWQVQRIRHRDSHRTYRYEMKYSVSPLRKTPTGGLSSKETNAAKDINSRRNSYQAYIQRDDDYPQSFGRLKYDEGQSFANRRLDDLPGRSFRQVPSHPAFLNEYRQATPMPQSTFMRGNFLLPPPPQKPAGHGESTPNRLNIGEYIKGFMGTKSTPKIELFPNLASRMGFPTPTTYRPNYNLNFVKPEVYQPLPQSHPQPQYHLHQPQLHSQPQLNSQPHPQQHSLPQHQPYSQPQAQVEPQPHLQPHPQPYPKSHHQLQPQAQPQLHPHPQPQSYPQPHDQTQVIMKFPDHVHEVQTYSSKLSTPVVTHHFHHHFYMPTPGEKGIGSTEQQLRSPVTHYQKEEVTEVTSPYMDGIYEQAKTPLPPAPQKVTGSIPHDSESQQPELQQQQLVHVTPVPPLRKPQIYQMYPIHLDAKIPLFIYPAAVDQADQPTPRSNSKPFVQSERLDLEPIHYSEPDPLYPNVPESNSPQLETPPNLNFVHYEGSLSSQLDAYEENSPQPDSIAAQLPPPVQDPEPHVSYVNVVDVNSDAHEQSIIIPKEGDQAQEQSYKVPKENDQDQEHNPSLKDIQISTEKTSSSTVRTEPTPTQKTTTTMMATTPTAEPEEAVVTTTAETTSVRPLGKSTIANTIMHRNGAFVSTSTVETPLRTAARSRGSYTRTTTEQPVLKWKPRRKVKSAVGVNREAEVAKGSSKHEQMVSLNAEVLSSPNATRQSERAVEVLTQKSVSKSVSIKIGSNGEEIPIIVDDDENEVQAKP